MLDCHEFFFDAKFLMTIRKSSRWPHQGSAVHASPKKFLLTASVGVVAFLGVVAAFALPPPADDGEVKLETILERLSPPARQLPFAQESGFFREVTIQRSDTFSSVMTRLGILDDAALEFFRSNPGTQEVARQLRPGTTVTANTDSNGKLLAVHFPSASKASSFVVERAGEDFVAGERDLHAEQTTVVKSGEISNSLFGATDAADIPDAIAIQMADIFGGDIDFHRDLRKGDRFRVTYEASAYQGKVLEGGRILAAEFVNDNKLFAAYWYESADGKGGYFTAEGKNVHKTFLRSPLAFSRITSGYSSARLHPVLHTTRAHKGIDYGAPTGTPIRAVADATVDFAGRRGGYGNLIVLKHQGAYSTAYGHMSRFAPGIKRGSRVQQGDTIGFVGQTGVATGPHVHYEFRVNSQQVNPLAIKLPETTTLASSELPRFKAQTKAYAAQLKMLEDIRLANAD